VLVCRTLEINSLGKIIPYEFKDGSPQNLVSNTRGQSEDNL
jgi:hypothetical protein